MVEHVVVEALDGIEDAAVEPQRGPHRPTGIGRQPAHPSLRARKPLASPLQLEGHQGAPVVIEGARHQLGFGIAKALQVFLGQVDAAAAAVFAHIPQDVGELVGNA